MRAFVIYTRSVPGSKTKGTTILEVEGEKVSTLEDPSVSWLPAGEFKFKITAPHFLYEKTELEDPADPKKKLTIPPIYFSHSIFLSSAEARVSAEKMMKEELEFEVRKGRIASYAEEDLKEKYALIQEIVLP